MKALASIGLVLGLAVPAAAQDFAFRPFLMVSEQQFAATQTFEAVFGQANQPFWGGGLDIVQDDQYYLELSASRFRKSGQRAFLNNGEVFRLNIPLTATVTPFELTGGYRFLRSPRLVPYVGGGVGLYRYEETSEFSTDAENVDRQHAGAIVEGGVEVRLQRWIRVAADAHYTYVPGILGDAGLSKDAGEKSLGGIAARFKVLVGR